jgi:hypothetical protein
MKIYTTPLCGWATNYELNSKFKETEPSVCNLPEISRETNQVVDHACQRNNADHAQVLH